MSQFFASGGQSIGVSASASVLPMNIQDWFPSRWTSCISLQSKGLSRVFSSTTVGLYIFLKLTVCVYVCVCWHFSRVQLFATPWTIACQSPLSMGFSKQEYWSGFLCPLPGDLPDPGIKPSSLMIYALSSRFFTTSTNWEALMMPIHDLSQRKHSVLSFTTLCGYAQSFTHVWHSAEHLYLWL